MRHPTFSQHRAAAILLAALVAIAGTASAHEEHGEPASHWHNAAHAIGGPDHVVALVVLCALLAVVLVGGVLMRRAGKSKDPAE